MILVANKVDLVQQRKVSEDDGRTLATRLNVSTHSKHRIRGQFGTFECNSPSADFGKEGSKESEQKTELDHIK